MSNIFRINLIFMGLPLNIQNKLDKEEITNTYILMNKIRMYNSECIKQKRADKIKFNNNTTVNGKSNKDKKYNLTPKALSEKKPCVICEALNKPDRNHPLNLCRNLCSNM